MKTNLFSNPCRGALTALSLAAALAAAGVSTARAGTVLTGSTSATGNFAVLVGGFNNTVGGFASGIITGASNSVTAGNSFIGCGNRNRVLLPSDSAAIVSGNDNLVSGVHGVITGGTFNQCSGFASYVHGNFMNDFGFAGSYVISDSNPFGLRSAAAQDGPGGPDRFFATFNAGYNFFTDGAFGSSNGLAIMPSAANTAGTQFPARVGINTVAPTAALSVLGAANNTTGVWGIFSDNRLKENVVEMEDGSLDRLLKLRGVTYDYKDAKMDNEYDGPRRGWIAQEVEKVFPEWVSETSRNGMKMVTPVGIDALTVEALRELRSEKDGQIAARDVRINELEARLAKLEKLLEKAAQ